MNRRKIASGVGVVLLALAMALSIAPNSGVGATGPDRPAGAALPATGRAAQRRETAATQNTATAATPAKTASPAAAQAEQPLANTYATVVKRGYSFWRTLTWQAAGQRSDAYLNHTLVAVSQTRHRNGSLYYRLATAAGQVIGYINAEALAVGTNPGGVAQPFNRYATVTTKANYTIWRDLRFQAVAALTPAVVHQTFLAKTVSYHKNGAAYYALYRGGQFFGYLNQAAVTIAASPAGAAMPMAQYATTTAASRYTIWGGFDWAKKLAATAPNAPQTY
ncbi:GW dipeptide domain-containing protein [Lacticaseibacillus parakribbianus]|uniref:GW dipeptide domain-containing protein n=1 Tax=Lacticaseibacillus parakribbianus TaxID=2970927 RepID=UPI0021CB9948|nr:GW dipeptide domain-containing protein [Lacticaseibacillus parakribbianus]